ncbi:MAG: hypothetical protein ABSE64_04900 [Vulcanimicrobiaceae bacterium]|jgi:hypothetical protein
MEKTATLEEAKALISRLSRSDRASLRPWFLASFDAKGYDRQRPELSRDEPRNRG